MHIFVYMVCFAVYVGKNIIHYWAQNGQYSVPLSFHSATARVCDKGLDDRAENQAVTYPCYDTDPSFNIYTENLCF
jgi:hypothetical protein